MLMPVQAGVVVMAGALLEAADKLLQKGIHPTTVSESFQKALTAGEDQIQLSEKNLGSADVALLTAWLQRPEVSAAVTKVDIRHAAIDEGVLDTFKGAVPEGCDVVWEPPDDESDSDDSD